MVCMSPVATSGLVDKVAKDFDGEVTEWVKQLDRCVEVRIMQLLVGDYFIYLSVIIEDTRYK